MSWNKVLDFVITVKRDYEKLTGKKPEITNGCLLNWAKTSNREDITDSLYINQLGSRVLIKYKNQFNVDWEFDDGFYRECRGVVIDLETEELILTPYSKFFNLGERDGWGMQDVLSRIENAKSIEFSDKLDGSMQSYRILPNGEFINAGSMSLDSDRTRRGKYYFFDDSKYSKMCTDYPWYTFIFELIDPEIDPHVIIYPKSKYGLWLTGIRDVRTGHELSYHEVRKIADNYNITKVPEIINTTLPEFLKTIDKVDGSKKEGVVLKIDDFRVKIKYPEFLNLRGIVHSTSSDQIMQVIANNTYDDYISNIPQAYHARVEKVKDEIMSKIDFIWEKMNNIYENDIKKSNLPFPELMKYVVSKYKPIFLSGLFIKYIKTGKEPDFREYLKRPGGEVIGLSELTKRYNKIINSI